VSLAKKKLVSITKANGQQIIEGRNTELLNAQTRTCYLLTAALTDTRQNHRLGGMWHIALLCMGQLDRENGGLGGRKKEVKMLAGGQILEIRITHGDKYWGTPRDLCQWCPRQVTASSGTAQMNLTLGPTSHGQHPPCREGKQRPREGDAGRVWCKCEIIKQEKASLLVGSSINHSIQTHFGLQVFSLFFKNVFHSWHEVCFLFSKKRCCQDAHFTNTQCSDCKIC